MRWEGSLFMLQYCSVNILKPSWAQTPVVSLSKWERDSPTAKVFQSVRINTHYSSLSVRQTQFCLDAQTRNDFTSPVNLGLYGGTEAAAVLPSLCPCVTRLKCVEKRNLPSMPHFLAGAVYLIATTCRHICQILRADRTMTCLFVFARTAKDWVSDGCLTTYSRWWERVAMICVSIMTTWILEIESPIHMSGKHDVISLQLMNATADIWNVLLY